MRCGSGMVSAMFGLLTSTSAAASVLAHSPYGPVPRGAAIIEGGLAPIQPRWRSPSRHVVTIRPSRNDTDDVSDDFLWAMHAANNGGTVFLKPNETYIIGQKLDLTFLNDIEVNLEGEIKVRQELLPPSLLETC